LLTHDIRGDTGRNACRGTACRTLLVRSRTLREKGYGKPYPYMRFNYVAMYRTKKQVRSFMSLPKSPSPVRIAANQQADPGLGVRGLRGVTVNLRGQSVDSTMVAGQVAQPKKPRHDELKGLTRTYGPRLQRALGHLFGFCRAAETRRRRSVDSKRVVSQVAVDRGKSACSI